MFHLRLIRKTAAEANGKMATTPKLRPSSIHNGVCSSIPTMPLRATSAPKIKVGT